MIKLPSLEQLLEAGVHFGHQVRRGHPRMKPYIYGARDGVHIIDLTQSDKFLKQAVEFVQSLGKTGKVLLFVGTKKQARPIIEEAIKELNAPYLTERWIGGFLTNFEEIKKNIKLLKDFKAQKEKGELSKYTKKEQLLLDRKMAKLERDFKGVMELEALPDAIFVVDAVSDNIAIREANRLGIKTVAIADSNCNVSEIDYPVPGNDDAIKSIKILVGAIASAYGEGKKEALRQAQGEQEKAEKLAKKEEVDALKKAEEEEIPEELKQEVAVAEEMVEKAAVKDAEKVV
ncbi:MAG: 30S ribosomal protein S2 [Microgenomates group bacterium Gr01-1014_7]|nr:MAG: 30S ribosomal protein S2 [Microgenomates group bacterium Gr01-1014_7]